MQENVMVKHNGEIPTINVLNANKTKRKARSTRRRLNAMINNTSLHFSDTDSEGELASPRVSTPLKPVIEGNLLHPVISVTGDVSDDSSCGRRNSFIENLTDVDEIYSEPEDERKKGKSGLCVTECLHQAETEFEDMSNDEDEPIYVKPRGDILCDFNGETITTKEGDGPFSIEVRNQMSIDDTACKIVTDTPDILILPTTDSEDMEASDDDNEADGACGQREAYEDFDVMAASQIVMKNVNKMEHLLTVKEPDDAISDSHTDIEDVD